MLEEPTTQETLEHLHKRLDKQEQHIAILEKMLEQVLQKMQDKSADKASIVINTVTTNIGGK